MTLRASLRRWKVAPIVALTLAAIPFLLATTGDRGPEPARTPAPAAGASPRSGLAPVATSNDSWSTVQQERAEHVAVEFAELYFAGKDAAQQYLTSREANSVLYIIEAPQPDPSGPTVVTGVTVHSVGPGPDGSYWGFVATAAVNNQRLPAVEVDVVQAGNDLLIDKVTPLY